ncbi:MAG TPA: hypothetical protein VFV87_08590 [Pirellulaceae bacterium]|nr:hypothetical protein [Pirellulaceae bacterium]
MQEKLINLDNLLTAGAGAKTVPVTETRCGALSPAECDELKQLAILFAEVERELGESDDPDLRFAKAFAQQCALGDLGLID